ncbi:MAG: TonB-dependent receptor [Bacteroidota bacterium]|nr:TonB-dependent receptor [Bacteroidota bacterium]
MRKKIMLPIFCLIASMGFGQLKDSSVFKVDSLQTVTVTAFHAQRLWKEVPASIAVLTTKDIDKTAGLSMVTAVNTIPGVRMEERSPGSYRLSFRGSTLRSPFGVRNVKIYWNGLPLTDAAGNTYLNLINIHSVDGMEIAKGPASSMYGAGTGGVLLLKTNPQFQQKTEDHFSALVGAGSYGLVNEEAQWKHSNANVSSSIQQMHQQSDGYRMQSAMRKDMLQYNGAFQYGKQKWEVLAFYTDLYYQTPGGLTLAQMQKDPQQARLATPVFPGAVQQKAAVYNKTWYTGIKQEKELSKYWRWENAFMLNHTSFTNPFITNYEERDEWNGGGRTQLVYQKHQWQWITGAEWLGNHSLIDDYGNRSGQKDTVQFKDDLHARQFFIFSQATYTLNRWVVQGGLSVNKTSYTYQRLTAPSSRQQSYSNGSVLMPRISLLYKMSENISAYLLATKGFSTPTLAEIHPSDGLFHAELQPEQGLNYEGGIKGVIAKGKLQFDIAYYDFELHNAIVRRNNAAGAEYFINAGRIKENGAEASVAYILLAKNRGFIRAIHLMAASAYQPYRFTEYRQGAFDYTGNPVTGVPVHTYMMGTDIEAAKGYYLHILYNAVDAISLNDAADEYAKAYHLLEVKVGRQFRCWKMRTNLFVAGDNLLNELYSLGNDINAVGRRYYNPAANRNFYAALQLQW